MIILNCLLYIIASQKRTKTGLYSWSDCIEVSHTMSEKKSEKSSEFVSKKKVSFSDEVEVSFEEISNDSLEFDPEDLVILDSDEVDSELDCSDWEELEMIVKCQSENEENATEFRGKREEQQTLLQKRKIDVDSVKTSATSRAVQTISENLMKLFK